MQSTDRTLPLQATGVTTAMLPSDEGHIFHSCLPVADMRRSLYQCSFPAAKHGHYGESRAISFTFSAP